MSNDNHGMRKAFAVRDNAVRKFHNPFFAESEEEAKRLISGSLRDENSILNQNPNDFHLYEIGHFSPETGNFIPNDAPISICTIVELFEALMAMIARTRKMFGSDSQDGSPDNQ
jgi:uncharacterized protein with von Willebrand factor type A (vWA) domain